MRLALIPMNHRWQFSAMLRAGWRTLSTYLISANFPLRFRLEAALVWILTLLATLIVAAEVVFTDFEEFGIEFGMLGMLVLAAGLTLTRYYRVATQFVILAFGIFPIITVLYMPDATLILAFVTIGILLSSLTQPNRFTFALVLGDTIGVIGILVMQPMADAYSVLTSLCFLMGMSGMVLVSNALRAQTHLRMNQLQQQAETQRLEAALEHERALKLEQQAEAQRLEAALKHERALTLQHLIREASHDMKAPLSALNITLHLLNKFAEDPERRVRYADNLQLQVQHLVEIIDTMKQVAQDASLADTRPIRTKEFAALSKLASDDSVPTRPAPLDKLQSDDSRPTPPDVPTA